MVDEQPVRDIGQRGERQQTSNAYEMKVSEENDGRPVSSPRFDRPPPSPTGRT